MIKSMHIIRFPAACKILLAFIILNPLAATAGVYKWTDAQGNVHYGSERPADAETKRLNIDDGAQYNPYADPGEEAAKREEAQKAKALAREKAKEEGKKEAEAIPPVAKKPEIPKKEKKRRCQQARDTLKTIQERARFRELNAKGEFVTVTEKQRQKRMALERKDISKYCK